ncbi:MAG: PAS domain-containing protein, partial [Trebonia sp.]
MSVLVMLATAGAVFGLLAGARRHVGAAARGYRWLGAAALFWFAGLVISQVLAGSAPSGEPLSLADVAPLLGLASAAAGMMVLAEEEKRNDTGSVLPGLADGYVMAVSLLVIGWVVAFGGEFHHLNERPGTFLQDLLHPLADLAVLGALLPVLTVAWRRLTVPYIGLVALTFADSLGVGAKFSGDHEGILEQLAVIAAACLFGVAPWVGSIAVRLDLPARLVGHPGRQARPAEGLTSLIGARRSPITSAGAATIIAAVTVVVAALVVIVNGLASAPASGLALVIAGGAAVLVVAVRILMLVRENGVAMRMWREAGTSLRDLADRTGDMVLLCDLDGTISYASPLASGYSYPTEALVGKPLTDFVHPEDIGAARAAVAIVIGLPEDAAEALGTTVDKVV